MTLSPPAAKRVSNSPPRFSTVPKAASSAAGDEAIELAALAGLFLDPWQCDVMRGALGQTARGKWVASEVGVIVPRQALSVDTELLTTRGWVTLADIQEGDSVFHPEGHAVLVTKVHAVSQPERCYRVVTTDGRVVVADGEHLWTVYNSDWPTGPRTMTTIELLARGIGGPRPGNGRNEWRFQLPIQHIVKSEDVELPVDPYLFGAWLGDGTSAAACLTSGWEDVPHWVSTVLACGFVPTVRANDTCATVGITVPKGPGRQSRSFASKLRALGVMNNKHVPDVFLTAGTEQRLALLQGMLDTDGCCDKLNGRVEFCNMRRELAEACLFLARSLGWRATLREGRALLNGVDYGTKYRVAFTPKLSDGLVPFRLARKAANIRATDGGAGRHTVSIAAIEEIPGVPVRCITVDSPDGLFLAGRDLVASHNCGKGSLLEARELAGLFLFDEKLILHSAHEFRTASEGFLRIRSLIDGSDDLRKRVLRVNASHGEEGITMRSGARLKFVARTRGSGRGFSGDVIVLDEAYALTDAHMSAMLPTLSARKNPQVWYTSSAPLLESETLRRFCGRGREGDKSVAYFEWAAASDCESGDRDAWYAANPGMGIRLTEDFTEREFSAMDDVSFRRERLGIWEMEDTRPPVIAAALWEALRDPDSKIKGNRFVMALDVNPSRTMSTIAVAGARHDGLTHVEVLDRRGDVHWVVPRFRELRAKWGYVDCVIDERSAAWSFASALHDAGVTVIPANTRATTDSAGRFFDACQLGTASLRHLGQPELNDALHAAVPRPLGDAYAWDKRKSDADITALVAVSLAHWEWERQNVAASLGVF